MSPGEFGAEVMKPPLSAGIWTSASVVNVGSPLINSSPPDGVMSETVLDNADGGFTLEETGRATNPPVRTNCTLDTPISPEPVMVIGVLLPSGPLCGVTMFTTG